MGDVRLESPRVLTPVPITLPSVLEATSPGLNTFAPSPAAVKSEVSSKLLSYIESALSKTGTDAK